MSQARTSGTAGSSEGVKWLRGQCFCGTVQLRVQDAFAYAFYCHCSRCRCRTGAAYAAIGGIELEKLEVTAAEAQVRRLGDVPGNDGYAAVCWECCSPLYSVVRERRYAHVPLGILLDVPSRRPDHHIHAASKASWDEINDGLPQYEVYPP
jgi:hypothetical protein